MVPFNGQKNLKKKERLITYGLRLASIQWQKEHGGEWETIPYGLTLTSIQWLKELEDEREHNSLRIKTYFHSMEK